MWNWLAGAPHSEYATQEQLKAMAEAVKNSLKSALTAQAKRIADTEEKRSELCDSPVYIHTSSYTCDPLDFEHLQRPNFRQF